MNNLVSSSLDFILTLTGAPSTLLNWDIKDVSMYFHRVLPDFIPSVFKSDSYLKMLKNLQEKNIYIASDQFRVHILLLLLPKEGKLLLFGPYTQEITDEKFCIDVLEENQLSYSFITMLKIFYTTLPVVSESSLLSGIKVFLRYYDSKEASYEVKNLQSLVKEKQEVLFLEEEKKQWDAIVDRYDLEGRMLLEVQSGNVKSALSLLRELRIETQNAPKYSNMLRHQKNLCYMLNTLLRKSVGEKAVHPFYLDSIFWDYAYKTDHINDEAAMALLREEMLESYCILVREQGYSGHTPTMQKVLNYIDVNLGGTLRLKNVAQSVGISPQHLSKLFNNEMKMSFSRYINIKRAKKMGYLLRRTQYSIKELSFFVGFNDVSYASKVFHEEMGISPAGYRHLTYEQVEERQR